MRNFGFHLLALLALLSAASVPAANNSIVLEGAVTNMDNQPLPGATIIIIVDGTIIQGAATDQFGKYTIRFAKPQTGSMELRASSVGYAAQSVNLEIHNERTLLDFKLRETIAELASIRVCPDQNDRVTQISLDAEQLSRRARRSLVPTNPVAAIREPQISKQGSSHSSQIRINGTSPKYYLNGISIGTDPDHYGMFAIIPSSVVRQARFHSLGTDVSFGRSSVLELKTKSPFVSHSEGEISLCTIEATATYSLGNNRYYMLGTLRKSVLDKLVKQFDLSSDRTVLPPTNFSDLFVSTGVKLSPHFRLMLDHYYVRDFLSYNTANAVGTSQGVNTYQHSSEGYVGFRLEGLYDNLLFRATAATRSSLEEYRASSGKDGDGLLLGLNSTRQENLGNIECTFLLGNFELKTGDQIQYFSRRSIDMHQQNWNFLPPFSSTDNPYIYQIALNEAYEEYHSNLTELNNAAYLSLSHEYGHTKIQSGIRLEYFANLSETKTLVTRNRLTFKTSDRGRMELFWGTFAESPVANILEPYQVLIHAWLHKLKPIRTRLLSAGYSHGPLTVSVFHKRIINLPVPVPDFSQIEQPGRFPDRAFITMQSTGGVGFKGGSLRADFDRFLSPGLSLYASYAYTDAYKYDNGVMIPYILHAPHKFVTQIDYQASRAFGFGVELQVRSGYPYSPLHSELPGTGDEIYTAEYYYSVISRENSLRFPTNAFLNVHANLDLGRSNIFCSISNVTNRANPIVNSASGLIYDAGIMPTVGMTYGF